MPAAPSGVAGIDVFQGRGDVSQGRDVSAVSLSGRFVLNGRILGSQRGTPSARKVGENRGRDASAERVSTGYGGTWWLKVTTLQGARRLASYW